MPQFAPYLTCHNLAMSYGSSTLFEGLSVAFHPGERWGIVGPNGAGKSTLFRILTGVTSPDTGVVALRNGIRLAVVHQRFEADPALTVEGYLRSQLPPDLDPDSQRMALEAELDVHANKVTSNGHANQADEDAWFSRLVQIQDRLDGLSGAGTDNLMTSALRLGRLMDLRDRPLESLSGGQQKRLQILGALLTNPQLILLDEPTNHLDVQTVDWLEEFLLEVALQGVGLLGIRPKDAVVEPFAFVIISHDRALLDTLVNNILEIEGGTSRTYTGNYEAYLEQKTNFMAAALKTRDRMANLMRRELAWLRTGPKARSTKQKARIDRAFALDDTLRDQKVKTATAKTSEFEFEAQMTDAERNLDDSFVPVVRSLGEQQLVCLKSLGVPHPAPRAARHYLLKNLDLVIKPRMRVALLGPNGCGKSTLMDIISGLKPAPEGEAIFHELVKISYFDQQRNTLDKTLTVRTTVAPEGDFVYFGAKYLHVMAYLERFLFQRHDADRTVADLSGGEQARLLLARLMLEHGNLLVLDEPTNDLDINTLQILERNLADFHGGIVFTSHDRYFVQRVASHILAYTGESVRGQGASQERTGNWLLLSDLEQALDAMENMETSEAALVAMTQAMRAQATTAQGAPAHSSANLGNTVPGTNDGQALVKKKKLSFAEQKEFSQVEVRIAQLELLILEHTRALDEAYATSQAYGETSKLSQALDSLQTELKGCYLKWEILMERQG